ncbi:MAG: hypothetical protein ACXVEE_40120, partial [Polyangiales bacterium]
MAVFAVIASFVMLLAMVTQRTWVQCSNGTCDFHQLGHFGSKSRRVGSREIKATRVVEGEHPRLLVVTKRYEEIEIASDMPVDTLRVAATELDRFVASGAPTHRALIEPSWNKLAYAAIVLAIALGIRLLFEISVWLWFEIEEGELRAYRRSWLGTGVRTASVRLDQVAEIFV